MKKTLILIALVIIGLVIFFGFFGDRNNGVSDETTPENAELIAYGFIQDFIVVASPGANQTVVDRIMDVLSSRAASQINRETISSDLARFIGVQDVPDQGASVEDLQIVSPTESYLVVGLNYSGGRVLRDIHMVAEEGVWKVDRVSISRFKVEIFDREGNLIRNSPGMKSNVWYLVYEAPGQPALNAELEFAPSSICAEGVENNTCNQSALVQGTRVRILGEETERGTILVNRLELK